MYDLQFQETIIGSLESETYNIQRGIVALSTQGYLVNKCKYVRQRNANMLIHCFQNINILSHRQTKNVEEMFNKISML